MFVSRNRGSLFHRAGLNRTLVAAAVVVGLITAGRAHAAIITAGDIEPIPAGIVGSGNGTLDFLLFTESAGGASNSSGSFNGDNANTDMPTGNGKTTANESFITSIGELRNYYRLNFPDGQGGSIVNQIVLFVDINETGPANAIQLDVLTIHLNVNAFSPANDARNHPAGNDIGSSDQNKTNAGFSGGTPLSSLASPTTLTLINQGAGFADQAIFTGINPFNPAFNDNDQTLFHWESSAHDSGGETIFLSGDYAPQDLPEPTSAALMMLSLGALVLRTTGRGRPG